MSDTSRYPNGQPVGYSNRNLCEKCAGDLGDCNCPPQPADAPREDESPAAMLTRLANEIDGYEHPQFRVSDTARLRALAEREERGVTDEMVDRAVEAYYAAIAEHRARRGPEQPGWFLGVFRSVLIAALATDTRWNAGSNPL